MCGVRGEGCGMWINGSKSGRKRQPSACPKGTAKPAGRILSPRGSAADTLSVATVFPSALPRGLKILPAAEGRLFLSLLHTAL
jgi:hypothetical protein